MSSTRQDAICQVTDKEVHEGTLTIQPLNGRGGCIDKYKNNDWVIIIKIAAGSSLKSHYNHESII